MKKKSFKNYLLLIPAAAVVLASCTDLEIEETDSFIDVGFQGLVDPAGAVDQLYNNTAGQWADQATRYALYEVTTNDLLIPTRGADWGDNGRWTQLHQHTWGLEATDVVAPFDQYNANQLAASQIMDSRSNASPVQIAQAQLMRAFSMFTILELFGQVPFRDTSLSSSELPAVLSGQEAVSFIVADLESAISGLPAVTAGDVDNLNRGSQAAARYLLAKVLLNRHIYLGQLTGGGVSPDPADMAQVISLVDAIEADGFALETSMNYFEIFQESPDSETILWGSSAVGNRIFNTLHYNSTAIAGGGWNGFSTLSEIYDLFEGDMNLNRVENEFDPLDGQEMRRGGVPLQGLPFADRPGTSDNGGLEDGSNVGYGFLIGPQYNLDGTQVLDRPGAPLSFGRDFVDGDGNSNIINNDEQTGIRMIKYNPRFGGGFTSHNIMFRYAEAHLMRAEARLRSGGDPTADVNALRTARGATPLGAVSESDLLDEFTRELYGEGWLRPINIRFGTYLDDYTFKAAEAINNPTRLLFPIPLPQLLANPALVQNPGY